MRKPFRQKLKVSPTGFEPAILLMKSLLYVSMYGVYCGRRCSGRLIGTTAINWYGTTGSNRRPSACKADALPAELIPLIERLLTMVLSKTIYSNIQAPLSYPWFWLDVYLAPSSISFCLAPPERLELPADGLEIRSSSNWAKRAYNICVLSILNYRTY